MRAAGISVYRLTLPLFVTGILICGLNFVWNEALVPVFSALGAVCVIVGLTLPSFGPRLSRVAAWQAQRRAFRQMFPLWEAVTLTVPEVVLDPGPGNRRHGTGLRHVDRRLRRRVVEIGDGLRQLRPHLGDAAAGADARAGDIVSACLAQNYPLFSRGCFMRTGKDRVRLEAVGVPVTVSAIQIHPGTFICADADGVVAVPADAGRIIETAERVERIETDIVATARAGSTLRAARETLGYHTLQTRQP